MRARKFDMYTPSPNQNGMDYVFFSHDTVYISGYKSDNGKRIT
jgi:hypothetical protein